MSGAPSPSSRLRIVQVSREDANGGAARAAARLWDGLAGLGHDSRLYVSRSSLGHERVTKYVPGRSLGERVTRKLRALRLEREYRRYRPTRSRAYGAFSDDRTRFAGGPVSQLPPADVVNLHWISGFIDLAEFLGRVPTSLPLVWTLHDMNLFTGGCHYDNGCDGHARACGTCPALGSTREEDLSRRIWRRKDAAFAALEEGRLHIVTPSRWLAKEAQSSSLLGGRFETSVIPNGLDPEAFAPRDRAFARSVLGLPLEARVILFVAHLMSIPRKGFGLLDAAIGGMSDVSDLHLLSLGKRAPDLMAGIPHRELGFVSNERLLSLAYSAADVFVIPSLQDNLPNTVQEAMACGTPVVGFDVGGIPDMVRPGVTGALAEAGSAAALEAALRRILDDPDGARRMGEQARTVVLAEYTTDVQARAYTALYRRMIDAASGGQRA